MPSKMVTNDNFVWGIGSGNLCNFKYHIQQLNQTENKVGATVFQDCFLAMVFSASALAGFYAHTEFPETSNFDFCRSGVRHRRFGGT